MTVNPCASGRMGGNERFDVSDERWLPIAGYEGRYEVSDCGRVRSLSRRVRAGYGSFRRTPAKVLKPGGRTLRGTSYLAVTLFLDGVPDRRTVHYLVLETFVGPRPDGLVACHGNGDPVDNRVENLRWDTQSANILDAVMHGTHPESKKTECPSGHLYTPENTRWKGRKRDCKTCHRERESARYYRNKAA